ncbi:hypothetical protein [Paenibacillus sp. YN15]|uniref:hypothetical protein n=1 Tax=Paenibacillus sp. YN15 TaxID=1742774 RepID=UPI000DCEA78A|nr:hypothetical protein [Paenibacillus sp. YN15]RAV02333.1 hypothetical protein DQG13_09885 [Paenibacillus sp. YN15]
MKKIILRFVALGCACVLAGLLYTQFKPYSFSYTLESEHFSFYYTKADKSSIDQIRDRLEENYGRIVQDLAPPSMPKVKVRIYPNLADFHKEIDRKDAGNWLVGIAESNDEMRMVSPNDPESGQSFESILKVAVHEFTHVVTFNLTAYPSPSVNWLYESIACYEAGQFTDPKDVVHLSGGRYPTLAQLNSGSGNLNIYSVGYVMIEYIRDTWGMSAVRELITSSGNLPAVLGKTAEEFEKGWQDYVQAKYLNPKKQS